MVGKVSILLVGIGGYGKIYVNALLDNDSEQFEIVGAVEPAPHSCDRLSELQTKNIPIFENMEEFYKKHQADLAVISSPIQFHCPQSCYALEQGSNVLCEKPISATIQEALQMKKTRDETGQFLDIGYQWSHAQAIQELKQDIKNGVLGKPQRLRTLVLWPRDENYFNRNSWAGKICDDNGNWILDSVANNATAHYLHNMFYVLGDEIGSSALPKTVAGELYRAHQIENFDTAAFRIITGNNVELIFLASHAVEDREGPGFCYQFEKGKVIFGDFEDSAGRDIIAIFNDGRCKNYGDPFQDNTRKLWLAIKATGEGHNQVLCGPEAAMSQTITINAIQEQVAIRDFPQRLTTINKDEVTFVKDLSDILKECYYNWKLPAETGVDWAHPVTEVNVSNYRYFQGVKEK